MTVREWLARLAREHGTDERGAATVAIARLASGRWHVVNGRVIHKRAEGPRRMTTTDRDIRHQVIETLAGDDAAFDVAAIVDELKETYAMTGDRPAVTVASIPSDEYWAIVERHEA